MSEREKQLEAALQWIASMTPGSSVNAKAMHRIAKAALNTESASILPTARHSSSFNV